MHASNPSTHERYDDDAPVAGDTRNKRVRRAASTSRLYIAPLGVAESGLVQRFGKAAGASARSLLRAEWHVDVEHTRTKPERRITRGPCS